MWEWVPFGSGLALPFLCSWVGPGQLRPERQPKHVFNPEKEGPTITPRKKANPNPREGRDNPTGRPTPYSENPDQKERMGKARPKEGRRRKLVSLLIIIIIMIVIRQHWSCVV